MVDGDRDRPAGGEFSIDILGNLDYHAEITVTQRLQTAFEVTLDQLEDTGLF